MKGGGGRGGRGGGGGGEAKSEQGAPDHRDVSGRQSETLMTT